MKIVSYRQITPKNFDNKEIKDVIGRVVIGKREGAENFFMRIFEITPGGYTPKHTHDWEHEVFIHFGRGEVYTNGTWHPINADDVIFIPANEEHQIRNNGQDILIFLCLIPSKAPEL
ncbi:MAG: cupin domain-containing protein [Syntrophaceae bacterium]|nr:cupin domain-containing protein [Syntrophaceae bacterium]